MEKHLQKPLLSRAEVAAWLGVGLQAVAKLIKSGEITAYKVGQRQWRIDAESVRRYLEKGGGE